MFSKWPETFRQLRQSLLSFQELLFNGLYFDKQLHISSLELADVVFTASRICYECHRSLTQQFATLIPSSGEDIWNNCEGKDFVIIQFQT